MEVWDKKDVLYIRGYRISEGEDGKEQIVVTYGDGTTYTVDYSKEMEEKLTYEMETQFKKARSTGKVRKTKNAYLFSKFMGGLGTGVGITSYVIHHLPENISEKFFDGNDNILISVMAGGFIGGIALYTLTKSLQAKAKESMLVEERDRNRVVLEHVNAKSPVVESYPFIETIMEKGQNPFSIPNMENSNLGLDDLKKIIKIQNQADYLKYLKDASLSELQTFESIQNKNRQYQKNKQQQKRQ